MAMVVTVTNEVGPSRLSFKDDITRQIANTKSPERKSRSVNTIDSIGVRQRSEATSTSDPFDHGRSVEESLAASSSTEGNRQESEIDSKKGYPQVIGVTSLAMIVGALSLCWGIYIPRIVDDMNTSLAMASFAGALSLTIRAALAPWAGSWPARFGSQKVVIVGSTVISIGLIGCSFSTNVWELYLFFGLTVGMGLSMLLYPGSYVVIQWYRKKKAMMLGFALGSTGVGGFIYNIVAALLIERYDWRIALRLTVLWVMFFTAVGVLLIRDRVPPKKVPTRIDWYLFKDARFVLMFMCNTFFSFGYAAPFFFTVTWAERYGMSSTVAAVATGGIAISMAVGTPVQGWIGDRTARDMVYVVCMLCAGAVLFLWPVCKTEWPLLIVSFVYGFTTGGQSANTAAIITDWFPKHDPGKVNGLSGAGRAVGELFGPVLIAMLFDTSAEAAFMLSGAFMILTGISIYVGSIWLKIRNDSGLENVSYTSVSQTQDYVDQNGNGQVPMSEISRLSDPSQPRAQ
eukprot:Clim_evm3s142 gene=Clim_evmTU3s142